MSICQVCGAPTNTTAVHQCSGIRLFNHVAEIDRLRAEIERLRAERATARKDALLNVAKILAPNYLGAAELVRALAQKEK